MEHQEYTTQQHTAQQSTPPYSKRRRIRIFDRPEIGDSEAPSIAATVMILLGLIALIVLGIIIF